MSRPWRAGGVAIASPGAASRSAAGPPPPSAASRSASVSPLEGSVNVPWRSNSSASAGCSRDAERRTLRLSRAAVVCSQAGNASGRRMSPMCSRSRSQVACMTSSVSCADSRCRRATARTTAPKRSTIRLQARWSPLAAAASKPSSSREAASGRGAAYDRACSMGTTVWWLSDICPFSRSGWKLTGRASETRLSLPFRKPGGHGSHNSARPGQGLPRLAAMPQSGFVPGVKPGGPVAKDGAAATEIRVLGGLRATVNGRRVDRQLPGRKGRLLFTLMALNRHRTFSRAELIEVLWPRVQPGSPDAALSTVLSRLRRALGDELVQGRTELSLALPAEVHIDAELAEERVQAAAGALERGSSSSALEDAKAA